MSTAELTITAWVIATDSASSRTSEPRGLSTSAATNGSVNPGSDPTTAATALDRSFLTGVCRSRTSAQHVAGHRRSRDHPSV
jgi:hypothetical protein